MNLLPFFVPVTSFNECFIVGSSLLLFIESDYFEFINALSHKSFNLSKLAGFVKDIEVFYPCQLLFVSLGGSAHIL